MKATTKRLQALTACVLAALVLGSSSLPVLAAGAETAQDTLKIAVLSDTHYLSPTMIKNTDDYTTHLNSDRKMFTESSAILDQMLADIQADSPDVLLISGDLTKDGEREGHQELADRLAVLKEEVPGLDVYVVPGNHDVRNANAMNFNTADGQAVPAGRTEPEDFIQIYSDVVYEDDSIVARYNPPEGKEAGSLSYAARPREGFTIVAIDSARYSADNTDSGEDEHETSGAVSADLEKWVLEQIAAAKERGDTVIGLQHHGYIPHFSMEPDLLPMYLVNDYARLSEVFADAGMRYVFTGHMHANDIATMTTQAGNPLTDIETGSVVTYPSPYRTVTLTRAYDNGTVRESMDVKTVTGTGPITFTNPLTGQAQTIEDVTAYGKEHGFSNEMLSTTINGFLDGYSAQIAQTGSKAAIEGWINGLLGDSLPGGGELSLEKLIDVALPLLLPDSSSGETIYYDSAQGGIAIRYPLMGSIVLQVLIPNQGLKDTLNVLLDKLDREVFADPSGLHHIVSGLVADLTAVPLTSDGRTLLEYANYIYQSHLGGEDGQAFPTWVAEATESIENGAALAAVLDVVITDVAELLDTVLANITFDELVGSTQWDQVNGTFIPSDPERTPLIQANADKGGNIGTVLGILGAKWTAVNEDGKIVKYVAPAGTIHPEKGYTVHDFLYSIRLLKFDMTTFLRELLLGTPADPEEGTEATEGLLTEELKGQINDWLLEIVHSMGQDSNYPEDNDTTLTYTWKLADRTALNELIAQAEKMDLSGYTEASAAVLREALEAVRNLPGDAVQSTVDQAVQELEQALDSLVKKGTGTTVDPDETPGTTGTTQTPDDSQPTTGHPFPWAAASVAILAGLMAAAVVVTKRLHTRG